MTTGHRTTRRSRYSARDHQVETGPLPVDAAADTDVSWYAGPEGEHAFGGPTGYLRSKCREVRFTVLLRPLEAPRDPCAACQAVVDEQLAEAYL